MEREIARGGTKTPDEADPDEPRKTAYHQAEDSDVSGWVTTDMAALRRSPRRVREYIRGGKLVARSEGEGVTRRWLVSVDSLNALLDETWRARDTRPYKQIGSASRPRKVRGPDDTAAVSADELLAIVQELRYRLGRAEARAELNEKTESTLREERERLLADLERERERANRLEAELHRSRRRFFGF